MATTYLEWIENIVPMPKKNGDVQMCIDFRDLNMESLKEDFSLLHIDVLVDNTMGHEMMSFMDSFLRYNQIKMAKEERENTSFTTLWRTYCYKVVPFRLKNVGATY